MAKMNYDAINFKNKDVDRFSTKFGNGDPIKLKNSPLGSDQMKYAEKKYEESVASGDPVRKSVSAHNMAANASSSVQRAKAKVALQNDKSNWTESYGFKKTSDGTVVDTKLESTSKNDAKRLREMATNEGYTKSLRQRKLDEGIQIPSMTKAKKPIILAPTINTKKK